MVQINSHSKTTPARSYSLSKPRGGKRSRLMWGIMVVGVMVFLGFFMRNNGEDPGSSSLVNLGDNNLAAARGGAVRAAADEKDAAAMEMDLVNIMEADGPETVFYSKPKVKYPRNKFTLHDFVVNGVNLAQYGRERDHETKGEVDEFHGTVQLTEHFQLFENFDIHLKMVGGEAWWDLVHLHRDLQHRGLMFYMDKIAQKRYMQHVGYPIPKALALKYLHELGPVSAHKEELEAAVMKTLPPQASYVVKPTHMSSSSGVWLVRYDPTTQTQTMGYKGKPTDNKMDPEIISNHIVQDLHSRAASFESWALRNVKPGFVVEERYSAWDDDMQAAYEFKTFVIWGRVYMAYLKRGSGPYVGLAYRNGTILDCQNTHTDWKTIPAWLQFDKVVQLAEQLGKHKDMFRVDIFVGIPASEVVSGGIDAAEKPALRIAVSETEFHPTSAFKDEEILEEAARLWTAGYKMNIYKKIKNDEVPEAFLQRGYLSEEDAQQLQPIPEALAFSVQQID